MSHLENFKRQHREIKELVDNLTTMLKQDLLVQEPTKVRTVLSTLAGKLMMHLAMEDQFLYPTLIQNGNAQAQTTAARFSNEMGGLVQVFKDYSTKWLNPSSIKADPEAFISESHEILQALRHRIAREDGELYPLVE